MHKEKVRFIYKWNAFYLSTCPIMLNKLLLGRTTEVSEEDIGVTV